MIARVGALLVMAATAAAQTPRFEVASIKENRSGSVEGGLRAQPGGRYAWTNTTLRSLIGVSHQRFGFDQREIVGGPDWIDRARFDVLVQTGSGTPPNDADGFPGPLFAMIRTLLQERFTLVVHNEIRQQPIYELVVAKRDGQLGPGATRVNGDCVSSMKVMTEGTRGGSRPNRGPDCSIGGRGPGHLQGNAITLDMLARVVGSQLHRPVVNKTGIAGSFDVELVFTPEVGSSPLQVRQGGDPLAVPEGVSLFTALQEQLGLKLESTRGPVDVLVVDRAERPTEN